MHNQYELYRDLRATHPSKKITFETSERFSKFQGLRSFLTQYHHSEGIKSSKQPGERFSHEEDSSMNEWFNNLNSYIKHNTNGNYTLRKNNQGLNSDKKVIFLSILELSTIINFRENELIDK
jgi:hypothetical protein